MSPKKLKMIKARLAQIQNLMDKAGSFEGSTELAEIRSSIAASLEIESGSDRLAMYLETAGRFGA